MPRKRAVHEEKAPIEGPGVGVQVQGIGVLVFDEDEATKEGGEKGRLAVRRAPEAASQP